MILIYSYLLTIFGSQIYSVVSDKQSFSFVIDNTGSMSDDIHQVKISVHKIFDTVYNSKKSEIDNILLITFNDYGSASGNARLLSNTKDAGMFRSGLNSISVGGGGDCPEYSMEGIQLAIDNSHEKSYVFVFTDASAKDYYNANKIVASAQKKQIKVTFVLTGDCGSKSEPQYQAYIQVARETNGEVFNLYRHEVGQILNYAANLVDAKKTELLRKEYPPGYGHREHINVDSGTKNLIITGVGDTPKIDVTLPSGEKAGTEDLVKTGYIAIVKVPDVKPGVHTAEFGSKSKTKLSVVGTTTVDFKHAFSSEELTSLDGAPKQPVPDEQTHLLIQLESENENIVLNKAQILNMDDTLIQNITLKLINKENKIYASELFKPPNHIFKLAIIGTDETDPAHNEIKRVGPTPIKPQDVSLVTTTNRSPSVSIDGGLKIDAEYDEPLKLVCKVNGYPRPSIIWQDSSGAKLPVKESVFALPYDYLGALEIKKVNKNETYTCSASNSFGSNSKNIQIETIRKIYFDVLEKPTDTTIEYETAGTLACRIDANPPANINWFANGELISDDNKNFSITEDRFSLNILHMEPSLAGKYTCEAKNEHEKKVLECNVEISGLEVPKIDKSVVEKTVDIGSEVDIWCSATGRPKPKINWFYRKGPADAFIDLEESSEKYHINNANPDKHNGTYRCTADNVLDSDTHDVKLTVQYPPEIEPSEDTIIETKGNLITIPCNVKGSPEPVVKWFRNGVALTISPIYTIHSNNKLSFKVSLSNAGEYKCEARNKLGATTKSTTVVVPPTIQVPTRDLTKEVVLNRRLTLPCPAEGYPKPDIEWSFTPSDSSFPSVPSIRPSDSSGATWLPRVQLHQDGQYTCVAKNSGGSTQIAYVVKVLEPVSIDKSASEVKTPKGASTDIICRTKGIPRPSIEWFFRQENKLEFNKIKGSDEVYHIDHADEYYTGTYRCVAKNKVNKDAHETDLMVEYPPILKGADSKTTVTKGDTVTLDCEVIASPTASVQWFFNDVPIYNNKTHHIFRDNSLKFEASLDGIGKYTCTAKNTFGEASKSTQVEILVPPTIKVPADHVIPVELDKPFALQCEADGFPKPEIEWSFYSTNRFHTEIKSIKPTNESGIRYVSHAQRNHEGFHRCTATNEAGSKTITYEVKILERPKILNQYPTHTFKTVEGDLVLRVQCPVIGNPAPTVVWLKDGYPIAAGTEFYDIDIFGTLLIKNNDRSAQGKYTCRAENIVGVEIEEFEVLVFPAPEPGIATTTVAVSEGQTKRIPCSVRHKRTDLLRWYKDNKLIKTGELDLTDINKSDAGLYTCRVSNLRTSRNGNVRVVVGYGPKFVSEEEEIIEYEEGRDAILVCDAEGDPEPKVTWWFNGRKLANTIMINYFQMQLNNIGQYFCIVSNEFGVIRRSFKIVSPDCLLNVKTDFSGRNQPLFLSHSLKWPSLATVDEHIRIPRNEYITFACPTKFKNFDTDKVTVSCQGDSKYEYEGGLYSYMDFTCKEQHIPVMKSTGLKCLNTSANTEIIKIGYEVGSDFLDVYEVCLELNTREPLYTKNIMSQSLADVPKTSNHWLHKDIMPADVDTQFYCTPTTGLSVYDWRSWSVREECCFDKRQLVNPKDVLPGVPQLATFSYLNLAAHWGTCSTKNWDEMERRVRKLAKSTYDDLQIWTGVFHESPPTSRQPTYLWKVVQDLANGASLAIIQVNIADLNVADAEKYMICPDICKDVGWMKRWLWRDVAEGYTYCCSLRDFETAFGYDGLFNSDRYGRVLQEVSYLSETRLT